VAAAPPVEPSASSNSSTNAKPARARLGTLRVVTLDGKIPMWASLSVDGLPRGTTPLSLPVSVGPHFIRVERPGFATIDRKVNISSGATVLLRLQLSP
jgi:hypothetical protein